MEFAEDKNGKRIDAWELGADARGEEYLSIYKVKIFIL